MLTSLTLCVKAMFYASVISLILAYSSVIPIFKPLTTVLSKARFLSTAGLTLLFAQITPDTSSQKTAILVFAITVFLVTSAASVIASITKDEIDYARTLKMSPYRIVWEVIIVGKASQMYDLIRQNFAIAWMMIAMVESYCRSDGGIGILLQDQGKHFHMSAVYAIQVFILCIGMGCDWILQATNKLFFPYAHLKTIK